MIIRTVDDFSAIFIKAFNKSHNDLRFYDEYLAVYEKKEPATKQILQDVSIGLGVLNEIFRKHNIKREHRQVMGNLILNLSHSIQQLEEKFGPDPLAIDFDEDQNEQVANFIHIVFDLYEEYNRMMSRELSKSDIITEGQQRFRGIRKDFRL
jgi:hypothetical protein